MTQANKNPAPVAAGRGAQSRNDSHVNITPLDRILPLLSGVRRAGDGYRADCSNPIHGDTGTRGTLALSQGRENQVLLHCFSCSDVAGILAGVGLDMSDLYPQRLKDTSPEGRREARDAFRRSAWAAALRVLSREASIIHFAGRMFVNGEKLTADDAERVKLAVERIDNAREVLS